MDPRIEELLPFYVLDALTEEERAWVDSYLVQHPEARQQLRELERGATALVQGIQPVEPPPQVKEALMKRVHADAKTRTAASAANEPSRRLDLAALLRGLSLAAAALAIVWIVILNRQLAQLRSEVAELNERLAAQSESLQQIITNLPQTNPSEVITVSLTGTEIQPQVQGQLIADPNEQSAVLVISGLPPLESGRTYQVWLIASQSPVSAGLLTVDETGQAVLIVAAQSEIGSFDALGISIEPEGGSEQPTGEIVVLSDL